MTIRTEIAGVAAAVALLVSGGGGGGGEFDERLTVAVERIAECLCRETYSAVGGVSPGCLQWATSMGGAVNTPVYLEGGGGHYAPDVTYHPYLKVAFPAGSWRVIIFAEVGGAEWTGAVFSTTSPSGDYATESVPTGGWVFDFDSVDGGTAVVVGAGTGYDTWISQLSFCRRTPGIAARVVLGSDLPPRGVTSGLSAPLAGRPFFGPVDWQPAQRTSFVDVAQAFATDIQSWAEIVADVLDPSDPLRFTLRALGENGLVVAQSVIDATVGGLTTSGELGFSFAPLAAPAYLSLTMSSTSPGVAAQLAGLAVQYGLRLSVEVAGE